MKRLVALQVKCRLSVLVVADDTTKSVNNALITLAASEISENSEHSEDSEHSEISEASDHTEPAAPVRLSRAERRRAEKLARKLARRA